MQIYDKTVDFTDNEGITKRPHKNDINDVYAIIKYSVFLEFAKGTSERLNALESGYRRAPWWIKERDIGAYVVEKYQFPKTISVNGKAFYWVITSNKRYVYPTNFNKNDEKRSPYN